MDRKEIARILLSATSEAQQLLDAEFAAVSHSPISGSALDQCGLRDGESIVREYIEHNEFGLAIEHLSYMVGETGIVLSKEHRDKLRLAASIMNIEISI